MCQTGRASRNRLLLRFSRTQSLFSWSWTLKGYGYGNVLTYIKGAASPKSGGHELGLRLCNYCKFLIYEEGGVTQRSAPWHRNWLHCAM